MNEDRMIKMMNRILKEPPTKMTNEEKVDQVRRMLKDIKHRVWVLLLASHIDADSCNERITEEGFINMMEQLGEIDCVLSYLEDEVTKLTADEAGGGTEVGEA